MASMCFLKYWSAWTCPAFCMTVVDLNSGTQACIASTLYIESPPKSEVVIVNGKDKDPKQHPKASNS